MEPYDIIMLAVLATAMLFGAWKGLAWQIASMASIFVSYFVAMEYRHELAEHIDAAPPWNMFLAMLFLYLGASLLIWITFSLVSGFIDRVKLKEFDRHIGALLGLAKGALLCIIITLFSVTLLGEEQRDQIIHSNSGYYIAVVLDKSHAVMPDEIHDLIGPYIHSLDGSLEGSGETHSGAHVNGAENGLAQPPASIDFLPTQSP